MIKTFIVSLLVSILATGCISPVTPQSKPWQQPMQRFTIKPVAPGLYQMDQFITTFEGFSDLLKREIAQGFKPDVIIQHDLLFNIHEEEIRITQLAEQYGLRVFQSSIMGTNETSSEQLIAQAQEDASLENE